MAVDDRSCAIVAEGASLLFFSAIPLVNVRDHLPDGAPLSRSQLNILGSDRVKFPISGMSLCLENNRHLLVR